jgi:hypothetical protein
LWGIFVVSRVNEGAPPNHDTVPIATNNIHVHVHTHVRLYNNIIHVHRCQTTRF